MMPSNPALAPRRLGPAVVLLLFVGYGLLVAHQPILFTVLGALVAVVSRWALSRRS